MNYILFSLWFTLVHIISYTLAGVLALRISKDIYEGKSRLMDYLRDMSVQSESRHVQKWFIPGQIVRGIILSVVLYPVLGFLGEISFGLRFLFFFGLMFGYTHLASAAPCSDNIEGLIYLKERYINRSIFLKFHYEMIIYSVVLALAVSLLLF
ncbi:MAG TPA: hypothetical protein ENN91_01495 [Firmicutes bacterium]|mgnify:CR=1 FL=1|nr:hypothetical protein [Bacillota bacterium]